MYINNDNNYETNSRINIKKLLLGIIVALTSVSSTTLLTPTYATTTATTDDDDVPDTTTTTRLADIVNGTMIPSEDDIRDLVTGAITGAIQNIQIVQRDSSLTNIPPGSTGDASAHCPSGGTLTGGGFLVAGTENLRVYNSFSIR
jgi:hypothetical protein